MLLTYSAEYNGLNVKIDSILIENLSKGSDTVLYAPNTALVLNYSASIIEDEGIEGNGFFVSQNYPNPFSKQTTFRISLIHKQSVEIRITDLTGRLLSSYKNTLPSGTHYYTFYPGKENYYVCKVIAENSSHTFKMTNLGGYGGYSCKLVYSGYDNQNSRIKSQKELSLFTYSLGDQLRYTGFAKTTNMIAGSDVIDDSPLASKTYRFEISEGISCPDLPYIMYEGQIYNTVQIGHQCWLRENLNVGKQIWAGLNQKNNDTIEKYCYNNDPLLCDAYGGLYQWDEMMNYSSDQGVQGICPVGWHVPTISEWEILTAYLGGSSTAGYTMKEAGNSHWTYFWNVEASNSSGFTGLPGGERIYSQYFDFLNEHGEFWSSTKSYNPWGWIQDLTYEGPEFLRTVGSLDYGYSVRCIYDSDRIPLIITSSISDISDTSAFSTGEVTDEGSAPVTAKGVCWSTFNIPTIADGHTKDGDGTGSFTSFLSDLAPGTKYYYSAYATNDFGTAYGLINDFRTLVVVLPNVITVPPIQILDTSATCGGYVNDDGNGVIYERGVCWSTDQNPTTDGLHTHDTLDSYSFYNEITGLSPNSSYYFRAYATNKAGTAYGNNIRFITKSGSDNSIPCPDMPTVTYEGQTYQTIKIGDQCWLKENLNVGVRVAGEVTQTDNGIIEKYCYQYAPENANGEIYGGLYQWNEAMNYDTTEGGRGICPEGWHIPTRAEWSSLSEFLGGNELSGGALKESSTMHWLFPNTGATDTVGFSTLPAGQRLPYYDYEYGWFVAVQMQAHIWTSTRGTYGLPYNQEMYYYSTYSGSYPPEGGASGYSVRCIKD